ncbi:MAG: hypothetical protein WBC78_22965, partial [Candidatus Sulfotelmatobacter sp.]
IIRFVEEKRKEACSGVFLTSGDGPYDEERLLARSHGFRQGRIWRFVRQILLAGEETEEWPALLGNVIPYRPAQHGIGRLDRVENGALCNCSFDLDRQLGTDVCQGSQMLR